MIYHITQSSADSQDSDPHLTEAAFLLHNDALLAGERLPAVRHQQLQPAASLATSQGTHLARHLCVPSYGLTTGVGGLLVTHRARPE